jgi:uncharacterized protein (TIRG00374 family)
VGLLAFLALHFDVDLRGTWAQARKADLALYLLAVAAYYFSFVVRGARWRIMAASAGVHREPGGRLPSLGECALITLVGWFANAVVWLRVGDAYRAYAFSVASRGAFSRSIGILLAERVAEVVSIFVLFLAAMGALLLTHEVRPPGLFLLVSLALFLAALAALLLVVLSGPLLERRLPPRLREAFQRFHRGLVGSLPQLPATAALSAGGWLLEALQLYLVTKALGLSLGGPLVVFVAVAGGLLSSVPLTPGGLGVVEPGIVGLLALKLSPGDAVSVVLLHRSISYLSVIPVGAVAFALQRVWLGRRSPI